MTGYRYFAAAAAFAVGGVLAAYGVKGWGWFLFVGALIAI